MKKTSLVAIAAALALAGGALAGCTSNSPQGSSTPASSGVATAGGVLPVSTNPISNTSNAPGLSITYAAVEDNIDPQTSSPISDRLELTVQNSTSTDLTHVEIYYTMTDTTTGATENYYANLTGLTLPAGKATTIYFDNTGQPGHYPENPFSLYRSSTNQVDFQIEVSADGVQPATATATKSVGTGEVAGE